jgi:hypothetical protein
MRIATQSWSVIQRQRVRKSRKTFLQTADRQVGSAKRSSEAIPPLSTFLRETDSLMLFQRVSEIINADTEVIIAVNLILCY